MNERTHTHTHTHAYTHTYTYTHTHTHTHTQTNTHTRYHTYDSLGRALRAGDDVDDFMGLSGGPPALLVGGAEPRDSPTSESARRRGGRDGGARELGTDDARSSGPVSRVPGEERGEPSESGEGGYAKMRSGLALTAGDWVDISESLSWSSDSSVVDMASGLRRCMDITRTPRPSEESPNCDR
jgi:hypothetical protein